MYSDLSRGKFNDMAAVPGGLYLSDENQPKGKSSIISMDHESRKTLQSLQLSAKGEKLVGKGRDQVYNGKGKQIKPSTKPVKVFSDSEVKSRKMSPTKAKRSKSADFSTLEERATQTDALPEDVFAEDDLAEADREALELMGGEEASESYWKILAEERRKALNDTLEENEELHKEIDCLREENVTLTELANKASYLSSILQEAITSDDDNYDDVQNDGAVDDDKTESVPQRISSLGDSVANSSLNASKMFLSDDIVTSSPVHAVLHAISKSDQSEGVISPLFQDAEDQVPSSVLGDNKTVEEPTTVNAVIHRDNSGVDRRKNNRNSDEWVNVELNNDMVTSAELVISEKLIMKKDEPESAK
ncbi:uncharacterized protein LOC121376045 [Gigantopelta aegis]|uniref:uncharacterized protein LOC121376045 n=1 Tax=Gigantopelta aegis TaxID=1735272 RepID=UPI001B88CBE4|nr:uncharacterized protein LOC121376045 [Gigantopelta aegis]